MSEERDEQLQRMREALDRKSEEALRRSRQGGGAQEGGQEPGAAAPADPRIATDRQQDDLSARAKNAGHKKKTADKWNQ